MGNENPTYQTAVDRIGRVMLADWVSVIER